MEQRQTPEFKERRKVHNRKHREKTKARKKAHKKVENAIKFGNLVRQPCNVCGSVDSHAHHEDYNKPMEIIWLCPQHHKDQHSQ